MKQSRPRIIEAALLYPREVAPDAAELCDKLGQETGTPVSLESAGDGGVALLSAGEMRLRLSHAPHPLPADRFQGVLNAPVPDMPVAGMTAVIRGHAAHVTLSVGRSGDDGDESRPEFEARLRLCGRALRALVGTERPEAVFWGQSNRLLTVDDFLAQSDAALPIGLYTHPMRLPGGAAGDGTPREGLRLGRAEQFIGRPLDIVPAPLPAQTMLAHAREFVARCGDGAGIPADGARIDLPGGAALRLRHLPPDEDAPEGRYQLSVLAPAATAGARHRSRDQRPPRVHPPATAPRRPVPADTHPEDVLKDVFRPRRKPRRATGPDDSGQGSGRRNLLSAGRLVLTFAAGAGLFAGALALSGAAGFDAAIAGLADWRDSAVSALVSGRPGR